MPDPMPLSETTELSDILEDTQIVPPDAGVLVEDRPGRSSGRWPPPFGRLFGVPTFADEALVNQRDITMPAGDRATAIRMRAAEFVRLAGPRLGRFAVPESVAAG